MKKLAVILLVINSMAMAENGSMVNLDHSYDQFKETMQNSDKALETAELFAKRYQAEMEGTKIASFPSSDLEKEYQQYKANLDGGKQAVEMAADYASKYNKEVKSQ